MNNKSNSYFNLRAKFTKDLQNTSESVLLILALLCRTGQYIICVFLSLIYDVYERNMYDIYPNHDSNLQKKSVSCFCHTVTILIRFHALNCNLFLLPQVKHFIQNAQYFKWTYTQNRLWKQFLKR